MATGNTIGLYSTVSTPSVSAANTMSLYSGVVNTPITYPYGNANVANFLAVGSDTGGNVVSNIIASGNITADYYFGDGSQLTGLPATYGNANVVNLLANFGSNSISTTGNIAATNVNTTAVYNNGYGVALQSDYWAQLQYSNLAAAPVDQSDIGDGSWFYVDSSGAWFESNTTGTVRSVSMDNNGNLTAQGNVTGNYFLGNGSQLTGLPVQYGNANVATFLANFGSNSISTTGNISAAYFLGNVACASGIYANTIFNGNSNMAIATANGNATITAAGAKTWTFDTTGNLNLPIGGDGNSVIKSSANVELVNGLSGKLVWDNTNQLDVPGTVSVTGTVTGALLQTSGATGNIVGANYISANFFVGDGSLLTNVVSSYGNSNVTNLLANFGSNSISTTGNATFGNITDTGSASVTGNISAGNVVTGGLVSATGNITGNYFLGNGSQLTGLPATYGNSNVATFLAAFGSNTISTTGNATFGNITDTGSASVTGNVTGGNVLSLGVVSAAGNLTSGQQTIVGTGNLSGGLGNIIISGRNIATDLIYDPMSANTVANIAAQGRIVIGAGYQSPGNIGNASIPGNVSPYYDINRGSGASLLVQNSYNFGNVLPGTVAGPAARGITSQQYGIYTANITTASTRQSAGTFLLEVGGGSAANTLNVGSIFGVNAIISQVTIGGTGNLAAMGNTSVGHAASFAAASSVSPGSTGGNFVGMYSQLNVSGNANTFMGFATAINIQGAPGATGNFYAYYLPNNVATYGISSANNARAATNYYFLRNDDAVAQNQLGSLRSYTNYNYISPTTSGALTIDKTNSQVQQVNLTGNVTSVAFSNFVTSASDGTNTDEQEDIVRVYFNQGATGNFGVTLPTGATYHYTNGVNTITPTANTVTCMTVSAIRISSTTNYYITLDSEVSTANFVNINATGNISAGGTASVTGNITSSGNIAGGNIKTVGLISATGNITGGNITTSGAGQISAAGNITSGYALISNVVSTGYIFSSGDAQISGDITANGTGHILGNLVVDNNIFLPGNLSGNGNVFVNGTIAGGNIFSDYEIYANTTISAGGNVIGNNVVSSHTVQVAPTTPTSTSAGQPGEIVCDADYIYVCTAVNTWRRAALSSY